MVYLPSHFQCSAHNGGVRCSSLQHSSSSSTLLFTTALHQSAVQCWCSFTVPSQPGMAKRQGKCARVEEANHSASSASSAIASCPLSCLLPVRHCLHLFLSAADAVRLLQTSHSSAAVLAGYRFDQHVFVLEDGYLTPTRTSCVRSPSTPTMTCAFSAFSLLANGRSRLSTARPASRCCLPRCCSWPIGSDLSHADELPDTVKVLWLGWHFNQPLTVGHLPASLRELGFGRRFNQQQHPGSLPDGLEAISFGSSAIFQQRFAARRDTRQRCNSGARLRVQAVAGGRRQTSDSALVAAASQTGGTRSKRCASAFHACQVLRLR